MTDSWNPELYARFRAERTQPFHDLLALLQTPDSLPEAETASRPVYVVDLGCGDGRLTAELHARVRALLREAGSQRPLCTLGVDTSPKMLTACAAVGPLVAGAEAWLSEPVELSFMQGDIGEFAQSADRGGVGNFAIIFSNAALHWLPEHPALFAQLCRALAPGGQLAIQMPANRSYATHTTAYELATEQPYAAVLGDALAGVSVLAPEHYATLLYALGFQQQQVRLQVYSHELESSAAAVDWVRGTLLTWYESRLGPELYAQFLAEYTRRVTARLGPAQPFLLTYNRLLLWCRQ